MKAKFRLIPGILSIAVASGFASFASAAETDSSAATSTMSSTTSSAPSGESKAITKTAETYSAFAGSRSNAESLATGLRQGSEIMLTDTNGGTSTTFTPATKPMGYGNVDKAMALSSQQLATAGVAQPTAEQIKTSMMGGTITNDAGKSVELQGVLQMRADGMGWGKIAHELGVQPGHGYSPAHTGSGVTTASGASSSAATANKSGKAQSARTATAKHQNVSAKGSGIVSASGASVGHAKSFDKNTGQGTTHVSNSSGNHSGVIDASGHGPGGVHSASGSASHGSGDGGIAKGHLK